MSIEKGSEARRTFEDRLTEIQDLTRRIARQHHLGREEREDFSSFVLLRMLEGDCAILRKFRGTSSLRTYLTVVVQRLLMDFRVQERGKWRPSVAARRQGTLGCQLDLLVNREGLELEQALAIVQHSRTTASRDELLRIASAVPRRRRPQLQPLEDAPPIAVDGGVERCLLDRDIAALAKRTWAALARHFSKLPEEDRRILEMRFKDGLTVCQVAAAVGVPVRRLYPRLARCLKRLGARMVEEGIGPAAAEVLIGWDSQLRLPVSEAPTAVCLAGPTAD